ncbi:Uncharacterised protein [Mycobacteroides abscessus subsp. abscessus]|nr:Uncharacterised protein [Mycobacteroides abscessus subsp. abscessus]
MLPSTSPAFSSIGVFAAMSTCDQVSSLPCRIARPSLTMDAHDMPVIFLNLAALRTAAVKPRTREPLSSFSTSSVRSTRCGMPSTRVETTVPARSEAR